jgi:tetratricopeptide (TPR) repeat protein
MHPRARLAFPGILLVLAVFLAYLPVWHAGFIWDDDYYVTANRLLTAPDGLYRIWFSWDSPSQYFPLTYTWFRFERDLWGLQPVGYHAMNLLLHAANALLLWRLLKRLDIPGSWLAAALFALHPVQVESVAWVSELKNVLMLFFYLLAVWAWVGFIEQPAGRGQSYYLLALGLAALALCAKTTACTLPVTLLLILWLKRKPINWVWLAQTAPFFVLSLGMGLLTIWWERYHQGTHGALFAMTWLQRLLVAAHAFWFYLGKLVWPINLTFIYSHWTIDAASAASYSWLAAAAALGWVVYSARRFLGRGVAAALIFFVVTLGPVMGFIMLYTFRYTFVANHYQYVACIGPLALVAALIETGRRQVAAIFHLPASAFYLLPAVLGVLTWRQCGMYANSETLWHVTLAQNPDCQMAHIDLGNLLLEQGRITEAVGHLTRAVQLDPNDAEALSNLGGALARQGHFAEAIQECHRALELDPYCAKACSNIGYALAAQGHWDEAVRWFEHALQLQPNDPGFHANLGVALATLGKSDQAIQHYERAIQLNPDFAQAHFNLGNALADRADWADAIQHYQRAIELNPVFPDPHYYLALALAAQGKSNEAIPQFQQALHLATAHGDTALANSIRARLQSHPPPSFPSP